MSNPITNDFINILNYLKSTNNPVFDNTDWQFVIPRSSHLTKEFLLDNLDRNWSWMWLSMNKVFDWDFIMANIELPWDWTYVGYNPSITFDIVLNNPTYAWNPAVVTQNSNINSAIVLANPEYPWDYSSMISLFSYL